MADPTVPAPPTATPGAAPVAAPAAPAVAPPAAAAPAPAAPAVAAPPAAPGTLLTSPSGEPQGATPNGADPAPADIKITVPEGFAADKGMIDKFVAFAQEKKIAPDVAQGLFDQFVATQQAATTQAQTQRAEQITQWAEEARADPEIGGAKFDATLASAKKALQRFGNPELVAVLTETGLGNHKGLIKALAQVGLKISEDRLPAGTQPVAGEKTDPLKAMYDKSPELFTQ